MKKRPTSVTVIAWVLIAMAGLVLITSIRSLADPKVKELMSRMPISLPIQYMWIYVSILVLIISGFGMLKGRNWARFLYMTLSLMGLIIGVALSPFKSIIVPGIIVFIAVIFSLSRSAVNDYFAGRVVDSGAETKVMIARARKPKRVQKAVSIMFFVISGYFLYLVCFLAFMNNQLIYFKFSLAGAFGFAGLLCLLIGLACVKFYNWKLDVGIVFICPAALALFVALFFGLVMREPEINKYLPIGPMNFFNDYVSGSICMAILGAAGIVLIRISKKNGKYYAAGHKDADSTPSLTGS